MKLTPSFSSYLDFLRFGAALTVLLGHMVQDGFALGWIPIAYLSHEAVVVFFVMSGYIVYASTVARQGTAADYFIARASRIYSVALPAVVFCVVLSLAVGWFWPALAAIEPSWRPFSWADIGASLLFLNESWGPPTDLSLNGPYWSLCYEVWYYVLFGIAFFGRGRWRWPLFAIAAAIAGPAILVLFPIWLFGAWLGASPDRHVKVSPTLAVIVWVGSFLVVCAIQWSDLDKLVMSWLHNRIPGFWRLEAAQRLVTDYVIALAIGAHLVVYGSLPSVILVFFQRTRAQWTSLAGFSFTLYLFHRPITTLAGEAIDPDSMSVALSLGFLALVLLLCWVISFVTERQLPAWRAALRRLLVALGWMRTQAAR